MKPDDEIRDLRRAYVAARQRLFDRIQVALEGTLQRTPSKLQSRSSRRISEAALDKQLRGIEPLEGDVSVSIAILAGDDKQPPVASHVVKAYLDLLQHRAYDDDKQVTHLSVARHALDDPRLVAGRKRFGPDPQPPDYLASPKVLISVEPASWYSTAFDRARLRADDHRERGDNRDEPVLPPSPWASQWEERDYVAMDEAEHELSAARKRGGLMAEQVATVLAQQLAELRTRLLLDQPLSAADRPGPLPADIERMLRHLPSAADQLLHRRRAGGVFHLPAPGGSRTEWLDLVESSIRAEEERWRGFAPTPETPLGLDLAVRGTDASGKDLDNRAHEVLQKFEMLYCAGQRNSVVQYRAYRADNVAGQQPDIRALITTGDRLHALEEHIEASDRAAIASYDEWRAKPDTT